MLRHDILLTNTDKPLLIAFLIKVFSSNHEDAHHIGHFLSNKCNFLKKIHKRKGKKKISRIYIKGEKY